MVEKMALLGPVVENLLSEGLHPKLKRIFGILKRRGMLPPQPKSMQDISLSMEFISILATAQKAASTTGIESFFKMASELGQIHPDVLDIPNFEEGLREYNELLGNKQKLLNDAKVIATTRQARVKQQQQAQEAEMASHAAATVDKGASAANALSQTDVGDGQTALSALLGTGGNSQRL